MRIRLIPRRGALDAPSCSVTVRVFGQDGLLFERTRVALSWVHAMGWLCSENGVGLCQFAACYTLSQRIAMERNESAMEYYHGRSFFRA